MFHSQFSLPPLLLTPLTSPQLTPTHSSQQVRALKQVLLKSTYLIPLHTSCRKSPNV